MKGIELSEKYFYEFGKPMLEKDFPTLLEKAAIGLVGQGSECLLFDDDFSKDHDFEPGFCVFLNDDDFEKYGFSLTKAYNRLPDEYLGFRRLKISPAGGNRHGVFSSSDFYLSVIGRSTAPSTPYEWLQIPAFSLRTAVSGKLFVSGDCEFTKIRSVLSSGYPSDVRAKKLAAHLLNAGQAGQYNYPRLIARGETGAAQLSVFEFVKSVISCIYLLNGVYEPFYKWSYRGLRDLPLLSDAETTLSYITESGNSKEESSLKKELIEAVATSLSDELKRQNLSDESSSFLDKHALSVNGKIKDANLRNSSIFLGL